MIQKGLFLPLNQGVSVWMEKSAVFDAVERLFCCWELVRALFVRAEGVHSKACAQASVHIQKAEPKVRKTDENCARTSC